MYLYKVKVLRVVDGDTVDLRVDLGFRTYMTLRFRLVNMDAPERGQTGWKESGDHLAFLLADKDIVAETQLDPDNFGRWLCELFDGSQSINQQMIDDGYAVPYKK